MNKEYKNLVLGCQNCKKDFIIEPDDFSILPARLHDGSASLPSGSRQGAGGDDDPKGKNTSNGAGNKYVVYHLELVKAFYQTMKNGLWLLGIEASERM